LLLQPIWQPVVSWRRRYRCRKRPSSFDRRQ
jgi:hypothetical protein